MTVISILYPILWVYTILRVFLLNTKYCPRTKYDCIVSARSFRSFTGHDFIHLYIQIRWGTLELAAEEAMWTEEAIPEQMIEEHMANLEWEAHLEEEEERAIVNVQLRTCSPLCLASSLSAPGKSCRRCSLQQPMTFLHSPHSSAECLRGGTH